MASEEILGYEELARGNFLRLGTVIYRDAKGRERRWEAAGRVRPGKKPVSGIPRDDGPGAVVIWCTIESTGEWVLVKQFRPPAGCEVLEFPAGLIDPGESPEATAVRELWEETGLRGRVIELAAPALSSPGMSGERMILARMSVERLPPEGLPPNHQEDSENITAVLVHPSELRQYIARHVAGGGAADARISALAMIAGVCRNG